MSKENKKKKEQQRERHPAIEVMRKRFVQKVRPLIARNLLYLREAAGYDLEQLGLLLPYSPGSLHSYERQDNPVAMPIYMLIALAEFYGESMDNIVHVDLRAVAESGGEMPELGPVQLTGKMGNEELDELKDGDTLRVDVDGDKVQLQINNTPPPKMLRQPTLFDFNPKLEAEVRETRESVIKLAKTVMQLNELVSGLNNRINELERAPALALVKKLRERYQSLPGPQREGPEGQYLSQAIKMWQKNIEAGHV